LSVFRFINTDHPDNIKARQPVDHPAEIADQALFQADFPSFGCDDPHFEQVFPGGKTHKPFEYNEVGEDNDQEHPADRIEDDPEMVFGRHQPGAFYQVGYGKKDDAKDQVVEKLGEDALRQISVDHIDF